jgi:hypothetical protein
LRIHDFFTIDDKLGATPVAKQPFPCYTLKEAHVSNPKDQFRIKLTPEQKAQVQSATGKEAEAVELSVEELEERIAPITLPTRPGVPK